MSKEKRVICEGSPLAQGRVRPAAERADGVAALPSQIGVGVVILLTTHPAARRIWSR